MSTAKTKARPLSARTIKTREAIANIVRQARPTEYTQELGDALCRAISGGKSLNKICNELDLDMTNCYNWMRTQPHFLESYTRATSERVHAFVEEILTIADEEPRYIVDEKGISRVDNGYNQVRHQRIEARKWLASKMLPKHYGDKVQVSGDADNPIQSKITIEIVGQGSALPSSISSAAIDSSAKDITPTKT